MPTVVTILKKKLKKNRYEMPEELSNSGNKEKDVMLREDVSNDGPIDSQTDGNKNLSAESEERKHFMEIEKAVVLTNIVDNYEIKLCRGKKISIGKSLFAFRVVQFLWFGAASVPSILFGIFLKQRGLSLVELSSVFSVVFVFQLLAGFITGIITDKIGNAKPVTLFLMLSTGIVLLSMSLIPNTNSLSCNQLEETFIYSNLSQNIKNFSLCQYRCLIEKKEKRQSNENYTEISMLENASLAERFTLEIDNNKSVCDLSNISSTNSSSDLLKKYCCNLCANSTNSGCVKVKNGYLVAIYAVLILAFYSVWNTTFRFMNFVAVSFSSKSDSHFGKEQAVGYSGSFLVRIVIFFLLNNDKGAESEFDFDPVMWISAGMIFCAVITLYINETPILPPGKNLMKKALSLLRDVDILAFILLVFVAGNEYAFFSAFHFVFLQDIKAPQMVSALFSIVTLSCAFPVLLTSEWWLKKFGTNNLFVLCLLFYAFRYTAYSLVGNPWWFLLIDLSAAFTIHLFWVAVVVHCRNVAPVGFAATLNALTGTVMFGIGRSSGVFIGGMMMNYMGPYKAYRIMGAISFTSAILYSIFRYARRSSSTVNNAKNSGRIGAMENPKNSDTNYV